MRYTFEETTSVCPVCLKVIRAKKVLRDDGIYLEKDCPEHGRFSVLIWQGDRDSYEAWGEKRSPADRLANVKPRDRGCPYDCGLCTAHQRKGCCVLLELTARCNLRCPVCFASAGETVKKEPTLEELGGQFDYLMEHGGPYNIQLSGGEPTMRDDLPEIIGLGREKGFSFFQLNTNGLRLAQEAGYAKKLKDAGLSCVFLQFDGLDDRIYQELRGCALFSRKEAAIARCAEVGLGVVLVPVIAPGVNVDSMGEILRYAVSKMPYVRGVHFQPVSYFGRCALEAGEYRLTIPYILEQIERQTNGMVCAADFNGGNATNPYCTFQANYLRQADGSLKALQHGGSSCCSVSDQARRYVANQWSGPAERSCCGESTSQMVLDTSSLDDFLASLHNHTFAVSGMLFQDAYNLELDRLRQCYINEVDPRYGMVPFCAYNLTSLTGETIYR